MPDSKIINIFKSALDPLKLIVMADKVKERVFKTRGLLTAEENLSWIEKHLINPDVLMKSLDGKLWDESRVYSEHLLNHSGTVLADVPFHLGGGGAYQFLYFVARYLRPEIIVETGVAAGFTTHAFLSAVERNNTGKLYSSDFPYFRIPEAEKYIGILVDDSLKKNWELYINGDTRNLQSIISKVPAINLFHYDSDKQYAGRKKACNLIFPLCNPESVLIFDDIQDNSHFHDLILDLSPQAWFVFEFEGKYIGVIGNLNKGSRYAK